MHHNKILDSSNAAIDVENLYGQSLPGQTMIGLPLGTSDNSATGEIVLKAKLVGSSIPSPTPVSRTSAISVVTTSGTVTAGAKEVEFIFSSTYTGNILGVAFTGASDSSLRFVAPTFDTLGAIAYTVTAGSFRLKTIV